MAADKIRYIKHTQTYTDKKEKWHNWHNKHLLLYFLNNFETWIMCYSCCIRNHIGRDNLARSAVDTSVSTGTRIKILAASARVTGLTFTIELHVLVRRRGCLSRHQLPLLARCPHQHRSSFADSVVVAALTVSVARCLVLTVCALELDVATALVAGF